jgi:hypothetical protein
MMYFKKFVASIKVNGKVLREDEGQVKIPFSSEYSISLKNLNSVKAQARVSIDGEDLSGWLVLQPNSNVDLERSIKNGNLTKGNKFKFIERTDNIENHRGIGVEDGLIRIEYKFEKKFTYIPPVTTVVHEHHYNPWYTPAPYTAITQTYPWNQSVTRSTNSNLQGGLISNILNSQYTVNTITSECLPQNAIYAMNCSVAASDTTPTSQFTNSFESSTVAENTAGITVPGSISNQTFYNAYDFACEESEVMVLKLVGAVGKKKVSVPVTVDLKPTCTTCGRVNKATNKFCGACGTSLVII